MKKFDWPFKAFVYRTTVTKTEEPDEFMLEIFKRPEDLYNNSKPRMIVKGFDEIIDLNDSLDDYL